MSADAAYIGVDVGGTTIKAIAADSGGHLITSTRSATFRVDGSALKTLSATIDDLHSRLTASGRTVAAVGVCTPGIVDPVEGEVRFAANLDWDRLPLVAILRRRHGIPVFLEHDARTAALAEIAVRGISAATSIAFIPLGTGIAAAMYDRGTLITGRTGASGEIGHTIVYPAGELCTCGQHGCVEAYAGTASIRRRYVARGGETISVKTLVERIEVEPLAAAIWGEAVDALSRGLHTTIALTDPELVVLGGGLSLAGSRLLDPVRTKLAELFTWRVAPTVVTSRLGRDAGVVGATFLASQRSFSVSQLRTLSAELSARSRSASRRPGAVTVSADELDA
ncbi:glucokinase [Leifsonia sp. 98AMF]|uniref:ROK family protein n=1 Tax=unclassified Leifsonia TaxID=2663824 RepID=UPI00087A4BA2|nr:MULTISPECIES: ROK family protein [unclassified Leifsonia]SDH61658.1 glucokinase [Leifsonia sp. 197AMF]SDI77449.1 glucokinase [Leifsonia sp. 466MF]SDK09357.1 glucokinase [Leifsonia sp. 157MF]SDN80860.1 glucokinase [Leifsonia sp. 509MF]SEB09564.1 glucokinase [Leifsonia sp. 21MFCrub1.1]